MSIAFIGQFQLTQSAKCWEYAIILPLGYCHFAAADKARHELESHYVSADIIFIYVLV